MKTPRDLNGVDLIHALRQLGYEPTRQKGSHIRITTNQNGTHHETIPHHNPLKTKTLSTILKSIAAHHKMTVIELLEQLKL